MFIFKCSHRDKYLQGSPVSAVGGHDETFLLESLEPQWQFEILVVLVHPVKVLQIRLTIEPHCWLWDTEQPQVSRCTSLMMYNTKAERKQQSKVTLRNKEWSLSCITCKGEFVIAFLGDDLMIYYLKMIFKCIFSPDRYNWHLIKCGNFSHFICIYVNRTLSRRLEVMIGKLWMFGSVFAF